MQKKIEDRILDIILDTWYLAAKMLQNYKLITLSVSPASPKKE